MGKSKRETLMFLVLPVCQPYSQIPGQFQVTKKKALACYP